MAQVSGIEIAISADGSGLERGLNRAQGAISRFSKSAVVGLAGALSAGVFVAAAKSAVDYADKIDEMSEKVGIAAEELSALTYAAKVNGVSTDQLQTGLTMLIRSMSAGPEKFNALGVSIYDANGAMRSTNDVLIDVAEKFAGMENGAEKSAWALELFGRSGLNLLPVLNLGADGLEQATKQAKLFGLVVSSDAAKGAATFNDNMSKLQQFALGAATGLVSGMIPALAGLSNAMVKGAETIAGLGSAIQEIAPYAAIAVAGIAGFYAPAVLAGLAITTTGIFSLSAAIKAVTLAMMANPLGLLIGGLAAAAVAVFAFRDDIKSAIGVDIPNIAKDAINFVIRGFMNLKDVIKITYENLGNIVGAALVGMSNTVLSAITALSNKVIDGLNYVVSFANKIPGVTIGAFEKLKGYQFENVFADGAAQAGRDIGKAMAENAVTDYVGTIGDLASGAMSKVSQLFSGGAIAAGGGGDGTIPLIPGAGGAGKGEGGAASAVPGVAPSQEVGTFFIDRLQSIRDGFMTERETLVEEYNMNQAVLDNALLNERISREEHMTLTEQLAKDHAAALAAIQQQSMSNQLSEVSTGLGSMASAFQSGGKKMLKISKVFAAAQAIVDTIKAAVQAMANPALIDPASKFAAYAAVFAKGMSAVAAIKGVSESGGAASAGGGGGGGGRGGGGGGAAPAAASPTTTFQFTMMNDPMGFGEKFARQFIDQLNSTQRNGGTIRGVIA